MKHTILKMKYLLIGLIFGLFVIGLTTYAAVPSGGSIGSLFNKINNQYFLLGSNIKDHTVDTLQLAKNVNNTIIANKTSIATNNTLIGTNKTNVGTNKTNIGTNKTNLGTNKALIGTNKAQIGTNKAQIGTNTFTFSWLHDGLFTNYAGINVTYPNQSGRFINPGCSLHGWPCISAYVMSSQHYYSSRSTGVMLIGESGNEVMVKGQLSGPTIWRLQNEMRLNTAKVGITALEQATILANKANTAASSITFVTVCNAANVGVIGASGTLCHGVLGLRGTFIRSYSF